MAGIVYISKNTPIKIQWNEYARGFYCPSCLTGTANNTSECRYCGQKLLSIWI